MPVQLGAKGAPALDPAAGVEVAHPLRIADLLHVVDRDSQQLPHPSRAGRSACRTTRPLAVGCHQDDGQRCHRSLRLDVSLHPAALRRPLPQVAQVAGGTRVSPEPVEEAHGSMVPENFPAPSPPVRHR